jgi:hypothetical protein
MADLLDIAASLETVEIRGQKISVPGIEARGIIYLFQKFPILREWLTKKGGVSVERLSSAGPDIVAAVIAAGTGHPGDERYEAAARNLGISDQLDLVAVIFRVTLPKGVDSLLARLAEMGVTKEGASALAQDSK